MLLFEEVTIWESLVILGKRSCVSALSELSGLQLCHVPTSALAENLVIRSSPCATGNLGFGDERHEGIHFAIEGIDTSRCRHELCRSRASKRVIDIDDTTEAIEEVPHIRRGEAFNVRIPSVHGLLPT